MNQFITVFHHNSQIRQWKIIRGVSPLTMSAPGLMGDKVAKRKIQKNQLYFKEGIFLNFAVKAVQAKEAV